jgi:hypothetical protein
VEFYEDVPIYWHLGSFDGGDNKKETRPVLSGTFNNGLVVLQRCIASFLVASFSD